VFFTSNPRPVPQEGTTKEEPEKNLTIITLQERKEKRGEKERVKKDG